MVSEDSRHPCKSTSMGGMLEPGGTPPPLPPCRRCPAAGSAAHHSTELPRIEAAENAPMHDHHGDILHQALLPHGAPSAAPHRGRPVRGPREPRGCRQVRSDPPPVPPAAPGTSPPQYRLHASCSRGTNARSTWPGRLGSRHLPIPRSVGNPTHAIVAAEDRRTWGPTRYVSSTFARILLRFVALAAPEKTRPSPASWACCAPATWSAMASTAPQSLSPSLSTACRAVTMELLPTLPSTSMPAMPPETTASTPPATAVARIRLSSGSRDAWISGRSSASSASASRFSTKSRACAHPRMAAASRRPARGAAPRSAPPE